MPQIVVDLFFVTLVLACVTLVLRAVNDAWRGHTSRGRAFAIAALTIFAWLGITTGIALSGMLTPSPDRIPPNLPVLAFTMIAMLVLTLGPVGRRMVDSLSAPKLIGFQVFRVPVELVLFMLAVNGVGPELLSFEGRNFDIITGLTAPLVAWLVWKRPNKALVIGWNVLGLALLANVLAHAVLSMPGPMQKIFVQPGPEIVAGFPYIWLPAYLVPLAAAGHVLSLRQALKPSAALVTPAKPEVAAT
ncbi:MAG: hypothetical protein KDB90_00110 [Planctomycetes bacterium]|nr:hypothetical protein [Planctomycetota bacterium]